MDIIWCIIGLENLNFTSGQGRPLCSQKSQAGGERGQWEGRKRELKTIVENTIYWISPTSTLRWILMGQVLWYNLKWLFLFDIKPQKMHRDSLKNKQGEWAALKWEWKITQKMLFIVKIAVMLRAALIIFASKKAEPTKWSFRKGQQNDQKHNGWKGFYP